MYTSRIHSTSTRKLGGRHLSIVYTRCMGIRLKKKDPLVEQKTDSRSRLIHSIFRTSFSLSHASRHTRPVATPGVGVN